MKIQIRQLALAVALGVALPALGATMSNTALPKPSSENGVSYLSGGIGRNEARAMRAEAKHYPLSMTFTQGKDNSFLASVPVTIKNATGKTVLDTVSEGPILLVKLPPGKYDVTAEAYGKTQRRSVTLSAKGDTPLYFHWKQV